MRLYIRQLRHSGYFKCLFAEGISAAGLSRCHRCHNPKNTTWKAVLDTPVYFCVLLAERVSETVTLWHLWQSQIGLRETKENTCIQCHTVTTVTGISSNLICRFFAVMVCLSQRHMCHSPWIQLLTATNVWRCLKRGAVRSDCCCRWSTSHLLSTVRQWPVYWNEWVVPVLLLDGPHRAANKRRLHPSFKADVQKRDGGFFMPVLAC